VFVFLEYPSPSRRICIGSHLLPPLVASLVLQTRPNKNGPIRIKFVLEKQQMGPPKSFLSYLNNASLQVQFWAQLSNKRGQIRFMMQMVRHNWHATSDVTSDYVQRGKAAGTKLLHFVMRILHVSLNS
jgi:hypothetical protein